MHINPVTKAISRLQAVALCRKSRSTMPPLPIIKRRSRKQTNRSSGSSRSRLSTNTVPTVLARPLRPGQRRRGPATFTRRAADDGAADKWPSITCPVCKISFWPSGAATGFAVLGRQHDRMTSRRAPFAARPQSAAGNGANQVGHQIGFAAAGRGADGRELAGGEPSAPQPLHRLGRERVASCMISRRTLRGAWNRAPGSGAHAEERGNSVLAPRPRSRPEGSAGLRPGEAGPPSQRRRVPA